MFGHGKEAGQATIVARQTHAGTYRRGINIYAPTGVYHHVYDYVADVTPDDGGAPFRTTFIEMFESDIEYRPVNGDRAIVKIDAKDQSVTFDRKALCEQAKAAKAAQHSAFESIADAPPGF
jgi:hypothetical protein